MDQVWGHHAQVRNSGDKRWTGTWKQRRWWTSWLPPNSSPGRSRPVLKRLKHWQPSLSQAHDLHNPELNFQLPSLWGKKRNKIICQNGASCSVFLFCFVFVVFFFHNPWMSAIAAVGSRLVSRKRSAVWMGEVKNSGHIHISIPHFWWRMQGFTDKIKKKKIWESLGVKECLGSAVWPSNSESWSIGWLRHFVNRSNFASCCSESSEAFEIQFALTVSATIQSSVARDRIEHKRATKAVPNAKRTKMFTEAIVSIYTCGFQSVHWLVKPMIEKWKILGHILIRICVIRGTKGRVHPSSQSSQFEGRGLSNSDRLTKMGLVRF